MRSLRILHVVPYAPETWAYGGIPRLTGTLVRGLARRGHDVTVCSTDAGDRSDRLTRPGVSGRPLEAWPESRTADGVRRRVFPNLSNRLAYDLQLFLPLGFDAYMRRHAGSFDVAHLHACRNSPGLIAARHLRRAGVPYVLAPNGTAPRIERRRLAKRVYDAVWGQRMLASAARVLAVSGAERRQLRALGVEEHAIRVVPNPVDLEEFDRPPAQGALRQRLDLPTAPVVMFLGTLSPRKRVDVLVRAVAALRRTDARLVIAGNDRGEEPAIRRLVQSLGLADRTRFTGLLRGRDRLDALADADVVVYPSEDEIFGLVPLEAILSGTPVVVSDDCGCGEVISAVGGGETTPVGDASALARAIDRVLDAPEHWRQNAADASARVRAAYGHEAVCAAVDDVYAEVVH